METSNSDKNERRNDYLSQRFAAISQQVQEQRSLDKYLLVIAPGALVLSFSVLTESIPTAGYHWVLFLSWGFLIASVIMVLISIHFSARAWNAQIKWLDMEYLNEATDDIQKEFNRYDQVTSKSTVFALALCVIGLVAMSVFAALNLTNQKEHAMDNEDLTTINVQSNEEKEPLEKGSNPPSPAKQEPKTEQTQTEQKPTQEQEKK